MVDLADGYCFIGVSAASKAKRDEDYPNRHSELWFDVAERARSGLLCLKRLPSEVRLRLKTQALAPTWRLDSMGRRVVEAKERTKSRLGRSPDDMDALNLAYALPERWRRGVRALGGVAARMRAFATSACRAQSPSGSAWAFFGRCIRLQGEAARR